MTRGTVCRACLKVMGDCGYAAVQSTEKYEHISLKSLKEKISIYLPELDMRLRLTNPLVMCIDCIKSIDDFHIFKIKCKETEKMLRNYIFSYRDNCLGENEPVDLVKVAESLGNLTYNKSNLFVANSFKPSQDIKPTIVSHLNKKEKTTFHSPPQYPDDISHSTEEYRGELFNIENPVEVCDVKIENNEDDLLEKVILKKTIASKRRRDYESKYCKTCNRLFNQDNFTKHKCVTNSGIDVGFLTSGFVCLMCNKTFINKDKLRTHFYRNHIKKPQHKCTVCLKLFRDNYGLAIHMRVHTGERPYQCDICHKSFTTSYTYKNHKALLHDNIRPFPCTVCDKAFINMYELTRHGKSAHSFKKGSYACDVCSQTFCSKANLRQHKLRHADDRPFECDICFKKFLGINFLNSHRADKHDINYVLIKKFSCSFCEKSLETEELLSKHTSIHTVKKYECDICTKQFFTRAKLKFHMRMHSEEQPFQCDICGKTFSDKGILERHILTHSDDKPYVCDLCPKCYTNKESLTSHKFSHTDGYTVKCFVCSKQINKGHLKIHLRIHTGEKPFECEVCFKRFVTAPALRRHMIVHTKEKQFKCDICYKLYSTTETLKIHQRIHTEGKPFQCDICGSFFSEKNSVKKHRERKHNNARFECDVCLITFPTKLEWKTHKLIHNPYECDICKKHFTSMQRFNAHKRIHSDDKPHECDICEKRFRHMIHLQKHKRVLPEDKSRVCKVCKVKFIYSCESYIHKKCLIGS